MGEIPRSSAAASSRVEKTQKITKRHEDGRRREAAPRPGGSPDRGGAPVRREAAPGRRVGRPGRPASRRRPSAADARSRVGATLEVVVFTSDRGLCGAYNSNIIRRAQALIDERAARSRSRSMRRRWPVGKKASSTYTAGRRPSDHRDSAIGGIGQRHAPGTIAGEIADGPDRALPRGEVDEVVLIVYSEFVSALTQHARRTVRAAPGRAAEEVEADRAAEPTRSSPTPRAARALLIPRRQSEFDGAAARCSRTRRASTARA